MKAQSLPGRTWKRPLSSWLRPDRVEQPELLDLGCGTIDDVAANLSEMWRISRTFGGIESLTRHLYPRLLACGRDVTVADLGTGSAHIPAMIGQWGREQGLSLQVVAIDWAARNFAVARSHVQKTPEVRLLRADARQLPFNPGFIDFVISSLFLHHFAPAQVIETLRMAFEIARQGIIMSDLVRAWPPLAAFKLIQPAFARNYLTRHDGALSIRRAYTPGEMQQLAADAGLDRARLYTHGPWGMVLVADKPPLENR